MYKKELLDNVLVEFLNPTDSDGLNLLQIIGTFFSKNVVITKGTNRHPYAEVLHEMAEDMTKSFQVKYIHQDLGWSIFDSYIDYAFREKPLEPLYEYQYILNGVVSDIRFYTEYEAMQWSCKSVTKLEETKRERITT